MEPLITKKDLAKHWQVSEKTIDQYRSNGTIVPIKKLPCIRFNPQYIAKLDEVKLDKHSPLEFARLERKNKELQQRVLELESIIAQIHMLSTQIYIKEKE
ncbi:MAG: histidine kinase [Clostridium sp.]|nr:histidine kinase [Clostridium sp.]